ncbi:17633_t:CDS:1, partial [Cetraspora pellucida]
AGCEGIYNISALTDGFKKFIVPNELNMKNFHELSQDLYQLD